MTGAARGHHSCLTDTIVLFSESDLLYYIIFWISVRVVHPYNRYVCRNDLSTGTYTEARVVHIYTTPFINFIIYWKGPNKVIRYTKRYRKLLFVYRRRRRGTIEMTLVRPCVRPSIRPSDIPSVRSCPRNSSYVFHRNDLKFYRLPSYHMKMCMWFLMFISAIFDKVMALADSYIVPATPVTSLIELTSNFPECVIMIWGCALWPFVILAIFQLLNPLTEKAEIWWAISIWYTDYSDYG